MIAPASVAPTDPCGKTTTEDPGKTDPQTFRPGSPSAPDPFDIASLRLKGDYTSEVGVKKALLTVPSRKPGNAAFVRVRPGADHQLQVWTIEIQEGQEVMLYLVVPGLVSELGEESSLRPRALFTAIDRNGVVFIWPVKLSGDRPNAWCDSAYEAAKMAEKSWVRVQSNMSLGAYECSVATGNLPDPIWPEETLQDLIRVAFKDRLIDSLDHDVLRKLRGEV